VQTNIKNLHDMRTTRRTNKRMNKQTSKQTNNTKNKRHTQTHKRANDPVWRTLFTCIRYWYARVWQALVVPHTMCEVKLSIGLARSSPHHCCCTVPERKKTNPSISPWGHASPQSPPISQSETCLKVASGLPRQATG
jgi:hypothetical protein